MVRGTQVQGNSQQRATATTAAGTSSSGETGRLQGQVEGSIGAAVAAMTGTAAGVGTVTVEATGTVVAGTGAIMLATAEALKGGGDQAEALAVTTIGTTAGRALLTRKVRTL